MISRRTWWLLITLSAAVACCRDLVELKISAATLLMDAHVMTLVRKLRKLDRLDLRHSLADDVTVATFAAIGSLPHLDCLHVSGNACFSDAARAAVVASAAQRGTNRALRIL